MQAATSASASPPAAASPARQRAPWWKLESARRYLFGHDVFISYARADALDYARGLADALRRRDLDAYIDQLGTPPGSTKLPALLFARLRLSSMMVLVASPAAAKSWAVAEEVKTFMRANHNLFVVDVAGALEDVDWYREIRGSVPRKITPAELAAGQPSDTVIEQIVGSVDFTRREDRVKKVFRNLWMGIAAVTLAGGASVMFLRGEASRATDLAAKQERIARLAGARADTMTIRADAALEDAQAAETEAAQARSDASEAGVQRDRARTEAAVAEEEARTATDSVEARRRTARALDLANRAAAAIDHTGDGLARGALLSLESLEVEWTVEGMSAWMRAMTLIPPRLHLLHAHDDEDADDDNVTALAASADGRRLASAGGDGRVRVWEVRTEPDPRRRMRVSTAPAATLDFSGTVYALALSADGRRLAAGSRDRRLRVWELETGETRDLPVGDGGEFVRAAAFSPDGRWLAAAVGDSAAWLFDTRSWRGTRVGAGNADVAAVAFSPDGRWLMLGGRTLDTWNVTAGRRAARERLPRAAAVTALAFSRDGSTLALASRRGIDLRQVEDEKGGTLALGPFQALVAAPPARGAQDANASLAFSRDGRQLAYARRNEWTARVVDARSGDETSRMVEAAGGVAFGADWVATGHADGTVAFWPADGAKEVKRIRHPGAVLAASFSPDGRWLATSAGDAKVRIFGARALDSVRTVAVAGPAAVIGFSPGGARRLVAAREGALDVVESGSWRPAYPSRRAEGKARALAFSPDGGMVAAWYARPCARPTLELRVWDLASGTELAGEWPGCAASDGRTLPARRFGRAALAREAERWPRIRHGEEWTSPDGEWNVATPDPLAVLEEAATGREVARLTHGGDVEGIAFSPDGTWLATASRDRTLRLWLFGDPERMIAEACTRLPLRLREQPKSRAADAPRNLCAERADRSRADP